MSRMSDYQIDVCESKREELVEDETDRLMDEVLNDGAKFDQLDSDYEVLTRYSSQIQRCLRNLDDAIKGKDYAQNAIYTALNYMQTDIKRLMRGIAEETVSSVEELNEDYHAEQLDARMDSAKDRRMGL